MTLKILRFLQVLFLNTGYFIEDFADSIDKELHGNLREAMADPDMRILTEDEE